VPLIPFVAALCLMAPRIWVANFGLLDDAVTLRTVRGIHETGLSVWDLQSGRSRPVYWLFWVGIEAIGGNNPRMYFLVNALLLLITLYLLRILVLQAGGSNTHVLLACSLTLLSIPTIENFYTLSKSEPLQVVFILLGFNAVRWLQVQRPGYRQAAGFLAIVFVTLLAALIKETTALLMPIAVSCLAWAYLFKWPRETKQLLWMYSLAVLAATVIFFVIRFSLVGVDTAEGYASGYEFSLRRMLSSASRWGAWILYAFPYLIPFLAVPFLRLDRRQGPFGHAMIILSIWIIVWIISFLPWIYVASYYLYPAVIGIGLLGAAILAPLLDRAARGYSRTVRILAWSGAVLFLLVQGNTYSAARQQILVDRVNWQIVEWIGDNLPYSSHIYVSLPAGNENFLEIGLHLEDQFGRDDLFILPLGAVHSAPLQNESGHMYRLTPVLHNQVLLSPRLGVDEEDILAARAEDQADIPSIRLKVIEGSFLPMTINPASVFCPIVQVLGTSDFISDILPTASLNRYCSTTPLIGLKRVEIGWALDQLIPGD